MDVFRLRTLNLVKNYRRLRGKGKPETGRLMDLIRIIFALIEHFTCKQLFGDHSDHQRSIIKQSINNYTYEVSLRFDGRIVFPSQGEKALFLTETYIYEALEKFENTFMSDITYCKDKEECTICLIKNEWEDVLRSQSISTQETSGGNPYPVDSPDSLGNCSNVPESSSKKSEGDSRSQQKVRKKLEGQEQATSHDSDQYEQHRQECKKKYNEYRGASVKTCKEKNLRKPGNILVYYDLGRGGMYYKTFPDEQLARIWAYENIDKIKDHFVYISDYEKFESKKSKDLEVNEVELLNPRKVNQETKNTNPKTKDPKTEAKDPAIVSSSVKGLFDSGSDVGVFPFDDEKMKPLIHSAEVINNQVEPIVYARLRINGELLEGIHKVNIISGAWCGFGVSQLQLMSENGAVQIVGRMFSIIKLE